MTDDRRVTKVFGSVNKKKGDWKGKTEDRKRKQKK